MTMFVVSSICFCLSLPRMRLINESAYLCCIDATKWHHGHQHCLNAIWHLYPVSIISQLTQHKKYFHIREISVTCHFFGIHLLAEMYAYNCLQFKSHFSDNYGALKCI